MGSIARRSVAEMGGEFLRETGVLVLVFYGLTSMLSGAHESRLLSAAAGTTLGLSSWLLGVRVERKRKE
jgi:hypothetical protein